MRSELLPMSLSEKNENRIIILVMFLLGINIVISVLGLKNGVPFVDFNARWKECAYLCHGISPYKVTADNCIEQIGLIDDEFVTAPWAWILGMIINPGFLVYKAARIWGMIFFGLIYVVTTISIYMYVTYWNTDECKYSKRIGLAAALLLGSQLYWWWAVACGNQGAIAACFIIMAICFYQKNPYLGGIFMTFAMIKPQLAAIFYLIFLFEKEYKLLAISLVSGSVAFLGSAAAIHMSPVELLIQTFHEGSSLDNVFFGLFDLLKFYGWPVSTILFMDIFIGICFVSISYLIIAKKHAGVFEIFSIAAVASVFWFYKQPHDNVILAVPCIACLLAAHNSDIEETRIRNYAGMVIIIFSFFIQGIVQHFMNIIRINPGKNIAVSMGRTIQCVVLIIIVICMLRIQEKGNRNN